MMPQRAPKLTAVKEINNVCIAAGKKPCRAISLSLYDMVKVLYYMYENKPIGFGA